MGYLVGNSQTNIYKINGEIEAVELPEFTW